MTDRWIALNRHYAVLLKSMSNKHTFNPIVSDFYKYTVEEFINEVHSVTMGDYSFQSRVRWSLENKSSYITSLILGMAHLSLSLRPQMPVRLLLRTLEIEFILNLGVHV